MEMRDDNKLASIYALASQRGFFFPSAGIYPDAPAGFWDYGPLGLALRGKIVDLWRKMIVRRDEMYEIDGSLILPESVFNASGHLRSFVDPLTTCMRCGAVHRADRLVQETTGEIVPESLSARELTRLLETNGVQCPNCSGPLSKVAEFNMMFRFAVGTAMENRVALRPETCQSIFLAFTKLYGAMRSKLPMGIAQVGKSFRNEISPRQGLVRLRELVQAETEVFFDPDKLDEYEQYEDLPAVELHFSLVDGRTLTLTPQEAVDQGVVQNSLVSYYLALFTQFYISLGIDGSNIRFRELLDEERPFYAASAWDLEIATSFGWLEVVANHYRTAYDLTVHSKGSGHDLSVFVDGQKVRPWVWEDSMGVDRTLLVVMDAAYTREGKRVYLRLKPHIAPVEVAVFPLVDKDGLTEKAREVYENLRRDHDAVFDAKDSIGRRYYRVDEIGVPFAVTVDYQTLQDDTVTIRDRDRRDQVRLPSSDVKGWLRTRTAFDLP
jgi:glycyl-tRNA synthetase